MGTRFTSSFIKKALRDMTIKRKLIAIIMLASAISLFLVGTIFIFWQWFVLRQSMVQNLSTQAQVIANNCKASIIFDEPKDANDVLEALKAEPSIIFGGIYTMEGEMFAHYHGQNSEINHEHYDLENKKSGYKFSDNKLAVYEPVIVEDKEVGIVCLQSTLSELHEMLKRNIAVVIGTLLIVSTLIFFVSSELQGIISEPILELSNVAKEISENQEYSVRVKEHSKDELGMLIKAFNEMLAQIQKRDLALVGSNERLEKKVLERTKDIEEEITIRRKAENELAQTVKKLTISNRELQEFTRIAAHDLQTPLRSIGILSDWIHEDYTAKFDNQGCINAKLLKDRAMRMSRLLYAIIQYSELSLVGRRQETLDLNLVLSQIISRIEKPENVDISIENELPVISGIRKFMEELFGNLISNSIRYMDKPDGEIKIGCSEQEDCWKFHISDNGQGIDPKYFDKVFKIFQMLSLRDETENIGIGLSIVKKIVELYDGRIWVESEVGQGSTFFFTLPKSVTSFSENLDLQANAILS